MNRTDILACISQLEIAFKTISGARSALYADVIEKNNLTEPELRGAIVKIIETMDRFPTVSQILTAARPPRVGQPPSDPQDSKDPIVQYEEEIAIQTQWLRRFESKGDDYGMRVARRAIERAQDAINRRLEHRGYAPRFVGVGVEQFGADEPPRHERQHEHWTEQGPD